MKCIVCDAPVKGPWNHYCGICRAVVAEIQAGVRKAIAVLPKLEYGTPCSDCGKPAVCLDHRYYAMPLECDPVCNACNTKRGPANDVAELVKAVYAQKAGIEPIKQSTADLYAQVEDIYRKRISEALDVTDGNKSRAARLLGIPRTTLLAKLAVLQRH